MKGPRQVLALGNVHPRLAPYAGIHHRQQGSGNLDEINSTQEARCGVAGDISNDSTSKSNHTGAPVAARANRCSQDPLHLVHILGTFSRRQHRLGPWNCGTFQLPPDQGPVTLQHIAVTDQVDPGRTDLFLQQGRQFAQGPPADQGRVVSPC